MFFLAYYLFALVILVMDKLTLFIKNLSAIASIGSRRSISQSTEWGKSVLKNVEDKVLPN